MSNQSRTITPSSWVTQGAVLHALILRELHTRFGRDNIGYLWLIGEPMMLATVISSIHALTQSHHPVGMHPFAFTVIGYCIFIIFRGIFNRAEGAVEGSVSLLHHRMVTPLDIMVVKAIIESVGCLASMAILLSIGMMLGIAELPARPLYLFLGAFLVTWWSFGWSLLIAGVTFGSHTLGRFVHPISYFMVPLSGAFWTMSFLPAGFRALMVWNPMVTMFEIARYGQFKAADDKYMYPEYAISICAFLTLAGLMVIRKLREKIQAN